MKIQAETKSIQMGIRVKMLLFFGGAVAVSLASLSLLNLFGVPFIGIKGSYQIHRDEVIQKINDLADLKKENIEHWFKERTNHIKMFAGNTQIDDITVRFKNGMVRGEDKGSLLKGVRNTSEYKKILQRAQTVLNNNPDYLEIRIADIKTGLVVFSTDEKNIGIDLSDNKEIKNAGDPGVVEQVYFKKEKTSGNKRLNIIYPIMPKRMAGDAKVPSFAAMLVIDPERRLIPYFHSGTGLEKSGEIIMIDMNRIILTPLKYPLPGNRKAESLEYVLDTKSAELAAWGTDGVVFAKDYRGIPIIAGVRHMKITSEYGVGLIAEIDEEEVFNFAREGLVNSLFISSFGLLSLLWLIYFVSGRIARPVTQLGHTAQKIMEGNLDERSSIKTTDEVGRLAGSFNSMVEELQKWHKELETKVMERTDALSESEERFRAVVSNTPDHILMQDSELRYTLVVNPQLGLTEQDMLGKTDYDFLLKEEADKLAKVKRRILETGEPMHFEISLISSKGKTEFFDGTYVPKYDDKGSINGLIGYFRNITERKKAEEELRLTNEELHAVNRIIIIITTTTTTTTTTGLKDILEKVMNEALNLTGLEGGTICTVTPEKTLNITAHRATSEATIIDLTTNEVKIGECLCGECARDHKPLILWNREAVLKFSTRESQRGDDIRFHAAFPLIVANKCLGVLCVFTRTDKKPSERRLKLLETVTSQIAIAIENAQIYEIIEQYAANLENTVRDRTNELKDSQRALMSLVEDLNQKSEELKSANERVKELDRLKSMFIASMSHELRTPLNSIIGFSSILLNEWIGPMNSEQKENMGIVLRSGRHLLELINDVIDISKIEAEKIEVMTEKFDLHDLVSEAASLHIKDMENKGLEFRFDSSPQPMNTDRRRLLQCIHNLMSNAIKFTEKGSVSAQIRVVNSEQYLVNSKELFTNDYSLTADADFVEISVVDTGIGIKEEDIPKLFQPFIRFDPPLKAPVSGTGLGLYLTKKLVNQVLKGEVEVKSRFGEGSTFKIVIPVKI